MNSELAKLGRGFIPVDQKALTVHTRMVPGEVAFVRFIRVRDGTAHRRYWKLMSLCAENCERIDLPHGGFMLVREDPEAVHTAIKLLTGHYDTVFDTDGRPAYCIPKSTSFDEMTKDEWNAYWPRVLDAVYEHILPSVAGDETRLEIERCCGMAR